MAVQYSTAVRNAMGDAWETAMGAAIKVQIRTGSPPANCAAASTGSLLCEFTLASDWSAAASSGVKTLSNTPISATASAAGTAAHYRFFDNAGTTCHEQGTITATGGGGDMEIDSTTVTNGQTLRITGYTKTWPGA